METAICQPDTLTLSLIADYFNVSIDYLFYGNEMTWSEADEKQVPFVYRTDVRNTGTDEQK